MTEEVRLKGFSKRSPVSEVQAWIRDHVTPLGPERVTFRNALGRVLAEDVVSKVDIPPFPRAAMDGYAVRAEDLPGTLRVLGELTAAVVPDRPVAPGEAARIMTGARIPGGADTVVMVEHTKLDGDQVSIEGALPTGKNVLVVGEDVARGRTVLSEGRWLRPTDVSLLVKSGALEVTVRRRPRVLIVPTGNELLPSGEVATGSQVVESNAFMLEGLARRDGAEPVMHPIVPDDMGAIAEVLRSARADVVLTSGGSSVGSEDFAPVVANDVGEVVFHGVALKPGSSVGLARIGETWVVIGPGYPVAAYVAWDLFVRPLICRLLGTPDRWPYRTTKAILTERYPKRDGRTEFVRIALAAGEDGELPRATPIPGGSAILSTLTRGDGFVLLPHDGGPVDAGSEVEVNLFD